jgi:hypothetical protein
VALEPKGGRRIVAVTERRAKVDFVAFVRELLEGVYGSARRVHLVLDNLNIHFRCCFEHILGTKAAAKLLRRVQFHYTLTHASWLNMAEIEIGILTRQYLDQRVGDRHSLIGLGGLAARPKRCWHRHPVDLHSPRCRLEVGPTLCYVIDRLLY